MRPLYCHPYGVPCAQQYTVQTSWVINKEIMNNKYAKLCTAIVDGVYILCASYVYHCIILEKPAVLYELATSGLHFAKLATVLDEPSRFVLDADPVLSYLHIGFIGLGHQTVIKRRPILDFTPTRQTPPTPYKTKFLTLEVSFGGFISSQIHPHVNSTIFPYSFPRKFIENPLPSPPASRSPLPRQAPRWARCPAACAARAALGRPRASPASRRRCRHLKGPMFVAKVPPILGTFLGQKSSIFSISFTRSHPRIPQLCLGQNPSKSLIFPNFGTRIPPFAEVLGWCNKVKLNQELGKPWIWWFLDWCCLLF